MVICPKCNKQIDHLDVKVTETNFYDFRIEKIVDPTAPEADYLSASYDKPENLDWDITRFFCPECNAPLDIDNTEEAGVSFLRGN